MVGGAQAALEAEQRQKIHQVQYLDLDLHPECFKMMESVLIDAFGRCFLFFLFVVMFLPFQTFYSHNQQTKHCNKQVVAVEVRELDTKSLAALYADSVTTVGPSSEYGSSPWSFEMCLRYRQAQ